jgi:hypothetical protein
MVHVITLFEKSMIEYFSICLMEAHGILYHTNFV